MNTPSKSESFSLLVCSSLSVVGEKTGRATESLKQVISKRDVEYPCPIYKGALPGGFTHVWLQLAFICWKGQRLILYLAYPKNNLITLIASKHKWN